MKPKNCLIFGASGQIGRHLIRKLTKNNYKVTAVTRNLHQKGFILKTQGPTGWIDCIEANIFEEKVLRDLINDADICINLIGILFEKRRGSSFKNIHSDFPNLISRICNESNIQQFIHMSSLGIERSKDSKYAKSKLDGEFYIKKNFRAATILRPSVVFSVDDNFTTNFMTLLSNMPIFPIFRNPKFMPIHVSDLTDVILKVISEEIKERTIECGGPEVLSLKEIILKLLKLINKKRLIINLPVFIGSIFAKFFQIFPKPLITEDQLKLMGQDNVFSGKYKTNFDIGIPGVRKFDTEVKKYCYMWKEAGQFSTNKYN